ncbi:hypothetical protein J3F83DRAFT_722356 [Trichoderma novae-zelandiae]
MNDQRNMWISRHGEATAGVLRGFLILPFILLYLGSTISCSAGKERGAAFSLSLSLSLSSSSFSFSLFSFSLFFSSFLFYLKGSLLHTRRFLLFHLFRFLSCNFLFRMVARGGSGRVSLRPAVSIVMLRPVGAWRRTEEVRPLLGFLLFLFSLSLSFPLLVYWFCCFAFLSTGESHPLLTASTWVLDQVLSFRGRNQGANTRG